MGTRTAAAVLAITAGAVAAPAAATAQQPTAMIAYTVGAAPGGLYTTALGGAAQPLAAGQTVGDPVWSPDGSRIAYVWQSPSRGKLQVRTVAAAGGASNTVVRNAEDPAWSPDGSRIAYISTGPRNGLRVVPAAGGTATTIAAPRHPRSSTISQITWLPNDRLAYTFVRWTGTGLASVTSLRTVSRTGGPSRTIQLKLPAGMALTGDSLSVSPSGHTLAVTIARRDSVTGPRSLALVPASGGAPTAIIPNTMSGSFSPDGTMLCAVQGNYPVFSTLTIVSVSNASVMTPGITAANCAWRPSGM
jgi:dipeptidyl aminopeptidase/acylaminoacyl peptidase